MNIVFVQSLIMNILFGITDENFKIRRSTFDIILFVIMFMNIVFVQSLIMNILFGITDENFNKTLQNSILNVYLLSIGDNHPMSIVTFSTAIRNVFSSILSISTMLLTNMFSWQLYGRTTTSITFSKLALNLAQ